VPSAFAKFALAHAIASISRAAGFVGGLSPLRRNPANTTRSQEKKLRTTQRKMLRWLVGAGRKTAVHKDAEEVVTGEGMEETEESEKEEPEPLEDEGKQAPQAGAMTPTEAAEPKSVTGALSRWARRREQAAGFAENIELCQPGPEPAEEPLQAWRPSLRLATTSADAGGVEDPPSRPKSVATSRQLQDNDAVPSKEKAQSATALVPSSHQKEAVKPAISGELTGSASSEKQSEDKAKPTPKTKSKARKASQEAEGEKNGLNRQVNQEEKVAEQPRAESASPEKQSEDKAKPAPKTKSKARKASQEAEGEKNGLNSSAPSRAPPRARPDR